MNTRKILFGGIAGGIVFFLLGWLIYGVILAGYMAKASNQCAMRPMDQMIWWALILANLGWGFTLAIVFDWSKTLGWKAGAIRGAIFGFLTSFSIDLSYYSMSTMYLKTGAVCVDILATVVMVAIGGAVIASVMGKAAD